ncbi:unnamed protein product, partial [Rangifer tarandus platyrhynchus]
GFLYHGAVFLFQEYRIWLVILKFTWIGAGVYRLEHTSQGGNCFNSFLILIFRKTIYDSCGLMTV